MGLQSQALGKLKREDLLSLEVPSWTRCRNKITMLKKNKWRREAREVAQGLRLQAAFPESQDSIPSAYMATHTCSMASIGIWHTHGICRHKLRNVKKKKSPKSGTRHEHQFKASLRPACAIWDSVSKTQIPSKTTFPPKNIIWPSKDLQAEHQPDSKLLGVLKAAAGLENSTTLVTS